MRGSAYYYYYYGLGWEVTMRTIAEPLLRPNGTKKQLNFVIVAQAKIVGEQEDAETNYSVWTLSMGYRSNQELWFHNHGVSHDVVIFYQVNELTVECLEYDNEENLGWKSRCDGGWRGVILNVQIIHEMSRILSVYISET